MEDRAIYAPNAPEFFNGQNPCNGLCNHIGCCGSDVWVINCTNGTMTWVAGSNVKSSDAIGWGAIGFEDPVSIPTARIEANAAFDRVGNLWISCGRSLLPSDDIVVTNDVWMLNTQTWKWA